MISHQFESSFPPTNFPDNYNALLYIRENKYSFDIDDFSPQYLGYRTDYLLKNLTELEDSYVICHKCSGIMREAVLFKSSVTCRLCSECVEAKPFLKVRDSISSLQIRCPLQRECDWKGVLSQAETHLDACEYLRVECPLKCKKVMMRSKINRHKKHCSTHIISCEHCHSTGAARDLETHHKDCHKYPIKCPNGCEDEITRGELEEHNDTCPKLALFCPFEDLDSDIECSELLIDREDIPEHNQEMHVLHLDMLHKKVVELEKKLNEMELKLKCKKDLDGCEWEIENPFTACTEYKNGPKFYVNGYKLRIFAEIKQNRRVSFKLMRLEGCNDDKLRGATITEYRKVLIDRNNPSQSKFKSYPLDYELSFGRKSEIFGTTRVPVSENNPLFRFYFDINSCGLKDIESSYEKEVEPVPTTF